MEKMIGNELSRILADPGYRGHNAPESHKLRVFTSGQMRRSGQLSFGPDAECFDLWTFGLHCF
ncbi:hypothetical protein [Rhizobium leguminosarum]|uniref:hypothetical protein n=1 Tax=Rhizobium TaxID=379 RepID=UPI0013DFD745|nr:hypothetical protein [Rhizobium leguminosarum]MBY5389620.1 hypothetical protein [Rhizobium leguminosarum]MBY5433032.1 hypothetical protein [Rhizobium leguminosarum]